MGWCYQMDTECWYIYHGEQPYFTSYSHFWLELGPHDRLYLQVLCDNIRWIPNMGAHVQQPYFTQQLLFISLATVIFGLIQAHMSVYFPRFFVVTLDGYQICVYIPCLTSLIHIATIVYFPSYSPIWPDLGRYGYIYHV